MPEHYKPSAGATLLALLAVGSLFGIEAAAKTTDYWTRPLPPIQSGPLPAKEAYWRLRCASVKGEPVCRAQRTIYAKRSGRRLASVAVWVPLDSRQPVMRLELPHGFHVAAGVSLQIGRRPEKTLAFRDCAARGCAVEFAIDEADILALQKRKARVTVSMQDQNRMPVTYQFPVSGFAEIYKKISCQSGDGPAGKCPN